MRKQGNTAVEIEPDLDEQERAEKERQRAADWAIIDQIAERNKHLDPDEVLRHVTEVVEEVRQELYERAQRQQTANRR
ncbi:MAG TPA: hypothetical protein VH482_05625 [Thermomicrobiales bacterium]|jgi:hypothetical protein